MSQNPEQIQMQLMLKDELNELEEGLLERLKSENPVLIQCCKKCRIFYMEWKRNFCMCGEPLI